MTTKKRNPEQVMLREFAAHARECKRPECARCGRTTCDVCHAAPPEQSARVCTRCLFVAANEAMRIPPRFGWAAMGSALLERRVAAGRPAIVRAAKAALEGKPLVLSGASGLSGTGKSSLAAACMRLVLARNWRSPRGGSMRFASAMSLAVARSEHPLGHGMPPDIAAATRTRLLVIDDLGSERDPSAIREVVEARHNAERLIWLTTFLGEEQIVARYGGGIARRLFETAVVVDCEGHQ